MRGRLRTALFETAILVAMIAAAVLAGRWLKTLPIEVLPEVRQPWEARPEPVIVQVRSCDPLVVEWAWSDHVKGGPAEFRCPATLTMVPEDPPMLLTKTYNTGRRHGYANGRAEGWEQGYRRAREDALDSGTAGWR